MKGAGDIVYGRERRGNLAMLKESEERVASKNMPLRQTAAGEYGDIETASSRLVWEITALKHSIIS